MKWESGPNGLESWLEGIQAHEAPPDAFELSSPSSLFDRLRQPLDELEVEYALHEASGIVDLFGLDSGDTAVEMGLRIAQVADEGREWATTVDLTHEESAEPRLIDNRISIIDRVQSIGPGGRVYVQKRVNDLRVEVSTRRRARAIASSWRRAADIAAPALEAVAESADAPQLRYAIGYHEASKYVYQELLRPVIVFLVEQLTTDYGVRWRIALVVPATDIEGFPLEAGLEGVLTVCS